MKSVIAQINALYSKVPRLAEGRLEGVLNIHPDSRNSILLKINGQAACVLEEKEGKALYTWLNNIYGEEE